MDIDEIVDGKVDPEDLKKYRQAYEAQVQRGEPSAVAAFTYAHGLIHGHDRNARMGISLLEELLRKEEEDIARRDYVYYLAVAHTRMKEFDRAMQYVDILLQAESHNRQAADLKALIEKRMRNNGLLGAAILGGGIAVIGGLVIAGIAAAARK
uniref:Mitochondrial fission 1 protein n=1 Tax=Plectus sambesii TaxID=2011161 RepID=A0A914XBK7_9BILA